MHTRTVEQVEAWDSRPFSGGFSGLHDLAEEEFTGAVVADDTWAFMLNGRIVGVFEGTIDEFDGASGTAYDAPDESLPLLFSMQERGGDTRAKYFTNDTPLREADQTLSDANFTGYVELSENVLSGDYYLVYYGGTRTSAAFIGQSERLLTGDEAFERAADEVGIYEVKDVSMNIVEIPAPREPASRGTGTTADAPETEETAEEHTTESVQPDSSPEGETGQGEPAAGEPEPETTQDPVDMSGTEASESASASRESGSSEPEPADADTAEEGPREPEPPTDRSEPDTEGVRSEGSAEPDTEPATDPASRRGQEAGSESREGSGAGPEREDPPESRTDTSENTGEGAGRRPVFEEEEEWRQTRSIPALDPEETVGEADDESEERRRSVSVSRASRERSPQNRASSEQIESLRAEIEERDQRIEELEDSLSEMEGERDDLERRIESLKSERDDLQDRVSNLESALQRTKAEAGVSPGTADMEPGEALSGTNLFVRYESKGKATLESLTGGQVDPEAVNENLLLEHHTQFDADDVSVGGEDFEDFLTGSGPYRFVTWLVEEFPYELLESDGRSSLGALYEAIPSIDRVEFDGEVTVTTDDGETLTETFDVVVRDRMGDPLAVVELNDERDPVRGDEMAELIASAEKVGSEESSLAGAFYVTASFFEPDALENAEDATSSGGFFSRSERASFVKTGRKQGFHLCLVEDRDDTFHLTVPEL
ncbi:MAG: hypothetical protein ABEJ27_03455 [Halodesulfurarchaeum sp.]